MLPRSVFSAAAATVLAAGAPAAAQAAWTPPAELGGGTTSNPGAFTTGVLTGQFSQSVSFAARNGDGFAPLKRLTTPDRYERVWDAGMADDGAAVVVTVRKHKPVQRVRATLVGADGTPAPVRTISDNAHSAAQPVLDVAPDGTAVAAWVWHDPAGWRVQAAIRKPGAARFGAPQNLSPPSKPRPIIRVAAGIDGRAVLSWQLGGDYRLPERPLHVRTAATDATFGADQELPDAGGYADTGLAVGPDGAVQVAYLDQHFLGKEGPVKLHVSQGTAGAPLSTPAILSTGGKGTSSGTQVAAAFSADGAATVAWAKPGDRYEEGGTLEVFTRPANGEFGPAQTLAAGAQGVALAAGPAGAGALAWMTRVDRRNTVYAATRPAAGGPFGAPEQLSADDVQGLWPSITLDPNGDAIAAWVTNREGSGAGIPTAAIHPAG